MTTTEKLNIRLLQGKSQMTKSVKEGKGAEIEKKTQKSSRDKWWSQIFFYLRAENTQELSLQHTGTRCPGLVCKVQSQISGINLS